MSISDDGPVTQFAKSGSWERLAALQEKEESSSLSDDELSELEQLHSELCRALRSATSNDRRMFSRLWQR